MNYGNDYVAPWTRVLILILTLIAAIVALRGLVPSVVPSQPQGALIFQSGILLLALGSAIIEDKYTKPADSVVNSLASVVALVTVAGVAPGHTWWVILTYCLATFVLALSCVTVSTGPSITGWRKKVSRVTYRPAVFLGQARLIFSIVFLYGLFTFYGTSSRASATVGVVWGIYMALWPLKLPQLLTRIGNSRHQREPVGCVMRREWPGLLRIDLDPGVPWNENTPFIYEDADGIQQLIVPLYKQLRTERALATGIHVKHKGELINGLSKGWVYPTEGLGLELPDANIALGGDSDSPLLGFILEDSRIGAIRIETWRGDVCREGLLVFCDVNHQRVYYQVTEGTTREESLDGDRLGSQVATAVQLGTHDVDRGFFRCDWLPRMNTPVFAAPNAFGSSLEPPEADFQYGSVPGTRLRVTGDFASYMDLHTAILGITGAGKTELAFDLVREAVGRGIKVICVDLTAQYREQLANLDPENLSLSETQATRLSDALFGVETGKFGAPDEKAVLGQLREELYGDIRQTLARFISGDGSSNVGLITLSEISNTKASLVVTELFMTALLHYARDEPTEFNRTLIVVEEAHTAMPESATMGVGDYESKGLVAKIAQIALQGRKYGVGLLIIAQRTATVSKTVLTQCNTVISFTSYDETTVSFLSSVYGREYAETLRELVPLQAVVFGKAVRSQRPVIVNIPYQEAKVKDDLGSED